ncbi:MAG: MFS transporter, partial [Anaerolineae bacterium]
MVGNVFATIAIPWFVLQTTGSATQTGITGFFTILPVVLAGFFGGTLIDRVGYKRTSIIADLASGVTVALIPFLHFT